jgi:hypothetical protein
VLELGSGFAVAVGVTEEQVRTGLGILQRRIANEPDKLDKALAAERKKHKQELTLAAEAHQLELKREANSQLNLTTQLEELKTENNTLKEYAERWKGLCAAENERYLHQRNERLVDTRVQVAETSVRKGELELESIMIKTLGALMVAGIGWWAKMMYDQHRSK